MAAFVAVLWPLSSQDRGVHPKKEYPEIGGCGKIYSVTVLFLNLPLVRLARWAFAKRVRDAVPPCWPNGRTKVPSHSPESFCRKGAPSYATASLRLVF